MEIKTFADFFNEINEELNRKIDKDFLTMDFRARDGPKIRQIERVRTAFYGAMTHSGVLAQPEEFAKMGYRREIIERAQSVAEAHEKLFIERIKNEYKILKPYWKKLKKEIENGRKKEEKKFAK